MVRRDDLGAQCVCGGDPVGPLDPFDHVHQSLMRWKKPCFLRTGMMLM